MKCVWPTFSVGPHVPSRPMPLYQAGLVASSMIPAICGISLKIVIGPTEFLEPSAPETGSHWMSCCGQESGNDLEDFEPRVVPNRVPLCISCEGNRSSTVSAGLDL